MFIESKLITFMKIRYFLLTLSLCMYSLSLPAKKQLNIGLCIVATGKYSIFVRPLVDSAEKYFCPHHSKTYFIFTDSSLEQEKTDKMIIIHQKRLGWPYDTLMRFEIYDKHKHLFSSMDYIFAIDADMLFVGLEGDEILSDRVATQHPGFEGKKPLWGNEAPYERNTISTAYISYDEGTHYFAGGFYGGSQSEFLTMINTITHNIQKDLAAEYIAIWHDESHLNRYFIDHKPTKMLDRSYCFPENGIAKGYPSCSPKLLALDKNHDEIRE